MKTMISGLLASLLVLVFIGSAGAYSMDFDSKLKWERTVSKERFGMGYDTEFYGGDFSSTAGVLTISHIKFKANKRKRAEVYLVTDSAEYKIGELGDSKRGWLDEEFNFSGLDLGEGPVMIEVRSTKKNGRIWLDEITLGSLAVQGAMQVASYDAAVGLSDEPVGSAAPVPEPTSLLLMGAGLTGLAAFRKRLRRPVP